MSPDQRRTLDELTRDLDLLVYRLESTDPKGPPPDVGVLTAERARLRRDLERIRDRLQDVVDALW